VATYGVTSVGFVAKPLSIIEAEVDADLRAILGDSAGTESDGTIPADSYAGQLKALIVDAVAAQWDLQQEVYASRDPAGATGQSLDVVSSITGILRDAARYSTVTAACVGDPLTILPAARVASVTGTGARFDTTAQFTIAAATAWTALTAYAAGDIRTNNNNIYRCITAGTSAGAGGPTTTAVDITDGTAHWKYLGAGTGYVNATFQAEEVGAIGALSGTLATIESPVSGWNAVDNYLDASVGATEEGDAALRVRREQALAAAGNTTVDAIRANILAVNDGSTDPNHEPPTEVTVFFNDTDFTNSDGLPPHSVEVLVRNGTDADIAQAIWDSVGAGTATYGTTTSTVTDSEGNAQTVNWTRPTAVLVYVTATAYYDAGAWPTGSDTAVAEAVLSALLTYTEDYPTGRDVRTSPLNAAMMRGPSETDGDGFAVVPASDGAAAVTGLLEITPIYIGTTITPVNSTPITISRREYALFDSTRCVITATTETP
jgi:uncharacterized phage protein gp47/JayE